LPGGGRGGWTDGIIFFLYAGSETTKDIDMRIVGRRNRNCRHGR
jgi:hypothetical protein